jgi:hypothetical protein
MRILFDNGTPRGVASALSDHTVEEARSHGWDTLRNGELLDAAEAAGFDVFLQRQSTGSGASLGVRSGRRCAAGDLGPKRPVSRTA